MMNPKTIAILLVAGASVAFAPTHGALAATDMEPGEATPAAEAKGTVGPDSEITPPPGSGEGALEPSTSAPHNPNDPNAPTDGSHRDPGQ